MALVTLLLVVAAFPFGIVFGALAHRSGLGFYVTAAMSALVFAGASQFIAVTLIASAMVMSVIVMNVFIVNLRHMLYTANLMCPLKRWQYCGFWTTLERGDSIDPECTAKV